MTPEQRREILRLIAIHLPYTDVWAYGSRVKWTSRPSSDLDLVAFAAPEQRRQIWDLREAFEESDLPYRVDLLVWDEIPESFQAEIDGEHAALVEGVGKETPQRCALEEVAHITMGQSPPGSSVNRTNGMPLLNGPTEFGPHHPKPVQYTCDARRRARPGDLLFCVRGSTGRMNWADQEYAIGRGIAAIRHRDGQHFHPFLRAAIESQLPALLAGVTGSVFSNVSATDLKNFAIPDLPPERQAEVAHILGTLDDRIELNRRTNETLEAMARALFKSWFVDFDPVRAKMEGRDTGLPDHIAERFPRRLVASPIGEIPKDWDLVNLGDVMTFNPSRRLPIGSMSPYLPMANMPTEGHIPEALLERPCRTGTRFANGDTLLARITPCLENGKTAYVDFLDPGGVGWGSTEYIVMRPKAPLPPAFAYRLARTTRFRRFAIQNMAGTSGRQRVSWRALSRFPLVRPSEEIAALFGSCTDHILKIANQNAREAETLSSLRDSLLTRLLGVGHDRRNRLRQESQWHEN